MDDIQKEIAALERQEPSEFWPQWEKDRDLAALRASISWRWSRGDYAVAISVAAMLASIALCWWL